MGMMEKMAGFMMGNMSPEEKSKMMENMMGMMMGGGKNAEEKSDGGGEMPWDMCKKMMSGMSKTSELATFATPEVRGLFEEWAAQIEEEMLQFIEDTKDQDLEKLAARFKLSANSISYFLTRLAQKGKINLKAEKK